MSVKNIILERGTYFRTGYIYNFKYLNYQNDPNPTVIVLNYVRGKNPKTGHLHNYIQAINFSYIPRSMRKLFLTKWKTLMEKYNGNVRLTWERVKSKYPYMKHALRRYQVGKGYILQAINIKSEILNEHVEKAIINDYSRTRIINTVKKDHDMDVLYTNNKISKKFGGLL
jgi:hypothetical protein